MGRIKDFFENIPNWLLNMIAVVSALITFIMAIVGLCGLTVFSYIALFYKCLAVVIVAMFLFVLRYMIKYKKLLIKTRKVTTEKYFQLISNFRNVYFEILSDKKMDCLSAELLTEKIERFLVDALNGICEIYKEYTDKDVCACVKYIDSTGIIDRETATIKTFARSSNSDIKRIEHDNINDEPIYIKQNTDFYSILSPNSRNKKSYFYQRNLPKYAKMLEQNNDHYNNSTSNWEQYYKATIVVPIRIANKRLFYEPQNNCYNVIGFLCVDSLSTDAFLEREERYNLTIARGFAAEIYVLLNQYKYYLAKIIGNGSSKNG